MSDVATLCEHCGYFHPEMHVRGIHGPFCPYQTAPIQSPASGTEMPEYVVDEIMEAKRARRQLMGQFMDPGPRSAMLWLADALAEGRRLAEGWRHDNILLHEETRITRDALHNAQANLERCTTMLSTLQEAAGRQQARIVELENWLSTVRDHLFIRDPELSQKTVEDLDAFLAKPSPSGASA